MRKVILGAATALAFASPALAADYSERSSYEREVHTYEQREARPVVVERRAARPVVVEERAPVLVVLGTRPARGGSSMCWKPTWVCFRREIEIEAALAQSVGALNYSRLEPPSEPALVALSSTWIPCPIATIEVVSTRRPNAPVSIALLGVNELASTLYRADQKLGPSSRASSNL